MHVLVIAQLFPPDMGGGATRAYNVAKGLLYSGCKVTVIAAFPHYPYGDIPRKYRWKPLIVEYQNGLKVIRTFVPPLSSKGTLNRMFLFVSFIVSAVFAFPFVRRVDAVWAANPNILSVFPAFLLRLVKGCPVVQNADDLWPEDLSAFGLVNEKSLIFRTGSLLAKIAYRKSDAITPISPAYVKVISRNYNVPEDKIFVVRAGVDLNIFRNNKIGYQSGKRERFKILYTGAFSVAYDFDQILNAAKELKRFEGIEFIIQGGGELADYIKERVKELGLKNVCVMEKIMSRADVAKLLFDADALILPLKDFGKPYLGTSSKLYEYQAAEKPIICCAEGQPAEYVEETGSGIVIKPGGYEALAKAILYLRESRAVAEKLGMSGSRYVENHLSIEKIGLKMKKLLETMNVKGSHGI